MKDHKNPEQVAEEVIGMLDQRVLGLERAIEAAVLFLQGALEGRLLGKSGTSAPGEG